MTSLYNIATLRAKARLNMTDNSFNKNELKSLFIHNYNSKNGASISSSLNNNMSYQCFRNAAYYLLSRLQLDIWNLIDTLPNINTTPFAGLTPDNINLYTIIQTFIELMDDNIIASLGIGTTIEIQRTYFLDNRLESLNTHNNNKYSALGVLKSIYKGSYMKSSSGGTSPTVINFFQTKFFKDLKISNIDYDDRFKFIKKNIDGLNISIPSNYILFKFNYGSNENLPSPDEMFSRINSFKIKKFIQTDNSISNYNLVGILYDCPKGIGHQVTSICYQPNCTSSLPIHNFHDDQHKILNKELNSVDFKIGTDTGLKFGCKNQGIGIQYVLYEKTCVKDILQGKIDEFIRSNPADYPVSTNFSFPSGVIIKGGDYKNKYLKYKQKYLQLKNSIN
jgi:hypothetical protein